MLAGKLDEHVVLPQPCCGGGTVFCDADNADSPALAGLFIHPHTHGRPIAGDAAALRAHDADPDFLAASGRRGQPLAVGDLFGLTVKGHRFHPRHAHSLSEQEIVGDGAVDHPNGCRLLVTPADARFFQHRRVTRLGQEVTILGHPRCRGHDPVLLVVNKRHAVFRLRRDAIQRGDRLNAVGSLSRRERCTRRGLNESGLKRHEKQKTQPHPASSFGGGVSVALISIVSAPRWMRSRISVPAGRARTAF